MAALAAVTAESTQAVGALLLLGLIAAPAGAARALTARPYAGLTLSAGLAVASMWGGLALAYAIPSLPPSTAIIGLAAGVLPERRAGRPRAPRRANRHRPGSAPARRAAMISWPGGHAQAGVTA